MKPVPKLTIQMVAAVLKEVPFDANAKVLQKHGYNSGTLLFRRKDRSSRTFLEYLQEEGKLGALYSDLLKLAKK